MRCVTDTGPRRTAHRNPFSSVNTTGQLAFLSVREPIDPLISTTVVAIAGSVRPEVCAMLSAAARDGRRLMRGLASLTRDPPLSAPLGPRQLLGSPAVCRSASAPRLMMKSPSVQQVMLHHVVFSNVGTRLGDRVNPTCSRITMFDGIHQRDLGRRGRLGLARPTTPTEAISHDAHTGTGPTRIRAAGLRRTSRRPVVWPRADCKALSGCRHPS